MKALFAAGVAALAVCAAAPAGAATFSAPEVIGTPGTQPATISLDGRVIGWHDVASVHLVTGDADTVVGALTNGGPIAVAMDPAGRPLLAWAAQDATLHAWDGGVASTLGGLPGMPRSMGATPW